MVPAAAVGNAVSDKNYRLSVFKKKIVGHIRSFSCCVAIRVIQKANQGWRLQNNTKGAVVARLAWRG